MARKKKQKKRNVVAQNMLLRRLSTGGAGCHRNRVLDLVKGRRRRSKHVKQNDE